MPDGDDRRGDLQNELDPGAERNEIVHRAGHDNDDAAEQYTLHRLVDARERQHSGEKAGKQRQPAEPGDRMIVDAPGLARHVHRADLAGKFSHGGRGKQTHRRRGEQREQHTHPQPQSQSRKHSLPPFFFSTTAAQRGGVLKFTEN